MLLELLNSRDRSRAVQERLDAQQRDRQRQATAAAQATRLDTLTSWFAARLRELLLLSTESTPSTAILALIDQIDALRRVETTTAAACRRTDVAHHVRQAWLNVRALGQAIHDHPIRDGWPLHIWMEHFRLVDDRTLDERPIGVLLDDVHRQACK